MIDFTQGDPRLFLDADGSRLIFKNGQPIMDAGLENLALISLFTKQGWAGNDLMDSSDEILGSDFEEAFNQPITLKALTNIENETKKALASPTFGNITVEVTNPENNRIDISIIIAPPGKDIQKLLLTKNGINWLFQSIAPAHRRV